jgi:hypothetical protein
MSSSVLGINAHRNKITRNWLTNLERFLTKFQIFRTLIFCFFEIKVIVTPLRLSLFLSDFEIDILLALNTPATPNAWYLPCPFHPAPVAPTGMYTSRNPCPHIASSLSLGSRQTDRQTFECSSVSRNENTGPGRRFVVM